MMLRPVLPPSIKLQLMEERDDSEGGTYPLCWLEKKSSKGSFGFLTSSAAACDGWGLGGCGGRDGRGGGLGGLRPT